MRKNSKRTLGDSEAIILTAKKNTKVIALNIFVKKGERVTIIDTDLASTLIEKGLFE